ncbi:MAG: hypothetical protein M0R51_15200 [Clostridia bacterium]|jgi:hypothetical protein|nr:hypothetical protein [Clostridia bacterium]
MTGKCRICDAGTIGRSWSKDLLLGRKTILEASIFFDCTQDDVLDHINNHEIVLDRASGDYESPDFYMNELLTLFNLMKDWVNLVLQSEKLDSRDMELGLKLSKETREILKLLSEFHGNSKDKDVNVNIELINMKYMQITNFITQELCPECQLKVINLMDQIEEPKTTLIT